MRIREITFRNFRNFRNEQRISFLDPITEMSQDLVVIAGTSGSGKTTILESIAGILTFVGLGPITPESGWFAEVKRSGLIHAEIELSNVELGRSAESAGEVLTVVIGKQELAEDLIKESGNKLLCYLASDTQKPVQKIPPFMPELRHRVREMQQGSIPMRGGSVFLPHDRKLYTQRGGPIEPPPPLHDWVARVTDTTKWSGSLEQLWVWQDYLDVKQRVQGSNTDLLAPFTEMVEAALGYGRQITIDEGRVYATVPWSTNGGKPHRVLLDQLPSGEQQCLLILGEVARRRRPDAIILIDEPEVSLHPTLQRLLLHQLRTFAQDTNSQLILATHSLEILRGVARSSCILLDRLDQHEAQFEQQEAA